MSLFNDSWPCFAPVDQDCDIQSLIDCGMVSVPDPQKYQISYEPTSMSAFDYWYKYPIADLKLKKENIDKALVKLARSNPEWFEEFIMRSLQKSAQDDVEATSTAITVDNQSPTLSINCNNNKDEEESEIKEAANLELDEDGKTKKNASLVLTDMSKEIEAVGTTMQKDENEIQLSSRHPHP